MDYNTDDFIENEAAGWQSWFDLELKGDDEG